MFVLSLGLETSCLLIRHNTLKTIKDPYVLMG